MKRIYFLVEKEFKQIFRNTILLRMMVFVPVIQLIMLSFAANYEVKNLKLAVLDQDHSQEATRLVGKFSWLQNFHLVGYVSHPRAADAALLQQQADLVLIIPPQFARNLYREGGAAVQLLVSAVDGAKAGIANGYASSVIQDFQRELQAERFPQALLAAPQLRLTSQYWYNPRLEYRTFMVPGILFELLLLVGGLITALNIVREKEIGTQEQLNVTPIRKIEFIAGKLIPFVIIGMGQFTVGLLVGVLVFKIPVEGSLALIYLLALLFQFLSTGLGLLISNISQTLQQAMFAAFFLLVLFILLSGLFSSTENMPDWAQVLNWFNPLKYTIEAGRSLFLKGSSAADLRHPLLMLGLLALGINLLAGWQYRKTS